MSKLIAKIQGQEITLSYSPLDSSPIIDFDGDADIDADGSNGQHGLEYAYGINNSGSDDIRNAKTGTGRYVGVLTHPGTNNPIVQGDGMPYPGKAFISTTSYRIPKGTNPNPDPADPYTYFDSAFWPGVVVPSAIIAAVPETVLGCLCQVTLHGNTVDAVVFDIGPSFAIGEISISLAKRLGISSNPRIGGRSIKDIHYRVLPGKFATISEFTFPLQHLHGGYQFPKTA